MEGNSFKAPGYGGILCRLRLQRCHFNSKVWLFTCYTIHFILSRNELNLTGMKQDDTLFLSNGAV